MKSTFATLIATAMIEGATPTPDVETCTGPAPVVDIRAHMHEKQREFFECEARERNVLGGRQGGKTFGLFGWQLEGMLEKPGAFCPYLALTRDSAKRSMWPEVVKLCSLVGIDSRYLHEATLEVRLPNGSTWLGSGTDDARTIERWRGSKTDRPAIDEMGVQDERWIRYFVAEIVWPTMIARRGQLAKVGTPGLTCFGEWHRQTNEQRDKDATPPLFTWTAWDNPSLGDVDEFIADWMRSTGLNRESIAFQREWLAIWIADIGALVYPFSRAINWVDVLPSLGAMDAALPTNEWRYVIGADIGWVDALAFAITATHPLDPDDYVLHAEKHHEMSQEGFKQRLREIRRYFANAPCVVDTGGVGKGYAEVATRAGVWCEAMEKRDKPANVRLYHDRLRAGRTKVVGRHIAKAAGAEDFVCDASALLDEWAVLGWDKDKLVPADGQQDHASDATIGALRKQSHYRDAHVTPGPQPGTEEHTRADLARLREQRIRRHQQGGGAPWAR